jgi:hypothetical protein
MPETIRSLESFNFKNMLFVCENTGNRSDNSDLDKSMLLADPGHGNALVAKTLNGHLIKVCSSRRLVALENQRRSVQSRFDLKVNEVDSVLAARRKLDSAKEVYGMELQNLYADAETLKKLLAEVKEYQRDLEAAKKAARVMVDEEERERSAREGRTKHIDRENAFFDSDERAKSKLKGWTRLGNGRWSKVIDGVERIIHYSIGDFVAMSFTEKLEKIERLVQRWVSNWHIVAVQLAAHFDIIAIPKFKASGLYTRLAFGKVFSRIRFLQSLRGSLLSHVSECNSTTLCPVCSSHSPPRQSRMFHCSNPRCGFRCERDAKSTDVSIGRNLVQAGSTAQLDQGTRITSVEAGSNVAQI